MTETISADGYGICLNDLSNHRPETDDRYQINYQGSSYLTTNERTDHHHETTFNAKSPSHCPID